MNTNKLKSAKFLKLLKESGVLLKGALRYPSSSSAANNRNENFNSTNQKA